MIIREFVRRNARDDLRVTHHLVVRCRCSLDGPMPERLPGSRLLISCRRRSSRSWSIADNTVLNHRPRPYPWPRSMLCGRASRPWGCRRRDRHRGARASTHSAAYGIACRAGSSRSDSKYRLHKLTGLREPAETLQDLQHLAHGVDGLLSVGQVHQVRAAAPSAARDLLCHLAFPQLPPQRASVSRLRIASISRRPMCG
jgi:hypothetical protein